MLKNGGRTFLDSDLDAGTKFYYVLVSYDTTGNRSAATAPVNATPTEAPDTTPPTVATGPTAAVDGTAVTLAWTASPSTDVAGYNLYRGATALGAGVKVNNTPVTATTFVDSSAPTGAPRRITWSRRLTPPTMSRKRPTRYGRLVATG